MKNAPSAPSVRYHLLDEVRGLSILLMVGYHALYDLSAVFGVEVPGFGAPGLLFLRNFFAGVFMGLAGISCRFSRSNLRRGALCLGMGLLLTLFTRLFLSSQLILFGILHFMGCSILLFWLVRPLLERIPPLVGVALCQLLLLFFGGISKGYLGFRAWGLAVPPVFYAQNLLFPLGLYGEGFSSADYYPLLPWFFLVLGGSFLGVYFREGLAPPWFAQARVPLLGWAGRHTLLLYLLHQPLLFVVFGGISLL